MSDTISFLNTITASGADLTLVAKSLNVATTSVTGTGQFPTISYPNIASVSISPSINETLLVTRVGWTAANSTAFLFTINQMVDGQLVTKTAILADSGLAASNTSIGTALAASFANTALKVTVAYTPANAFVTVTALTGYPTYQIVLGATGTMTQSTTTTMVGVAISASTVTASGTPSVITAAAHGQVNGDKITIASADNAKLASGTYIVQFLSANTYSLYDVYGNPLSGFTGTTTATVVKVAGGFVGSGTVLAAAGVTGASGGVGYAVYKFTFKPATNGVSLSGSTGLNNTHILYVKQWATTTTTTYTTNFAALSAKMNEFMSNYVAGGTIAVHTALTDSVSVLDAAVIV